MTCNNRLVLLPLMAWHATIKPAARYPNDNQRLNRRADMARASAKTSKIEEKIEEALTDASTEDLQAQVEQLKEDIAAIAATLANIGSQTVRDAKRSAKETYKSAYIQGEDAIDDLRNKAQDVEAQLTATVRERPIAALATALGVGYLLALLSRR